MVSDGRGAGGTGARRAATGGRRRRTDAPPPARPEAELAAAQRETAGLKRQAEDLERRLAAALEQQTATTEVLRAIASNPADLQAVLDAIGDQAVTLCGAEDALIDLVEDAALRPAGHRGVIPAGGMVFDARSGPLLPIARLTRGRVAWRALLDATTVHVPDILAEPPDAYPLSRQTAEQAGHRALLATPLLRDGRPVGVITLRRRTPGRFDAQQVSLLETFAHQAVIAIENARLFRELRDSNRALTEQKQHLQEALEQQTATADILRVIASSPTDLQRVLDAIAERASRLCGAVDTVVYRLEGDALSPVAGILVPRSNPSQAARPGGPMSQPTTDNAHASGPEHRRWGHRRWECGTDASGPERRRWPCCDRPAHDPHRRHPGRAGRRVSTGQRTSAGARESHDARDPARARGRRRRRDPHAPVGGEALHGAAGQAAGDVRRPGRDRDRERPPLPGAGGEQPHAHRGPGAADGDRGGAGGDQPRAHRPAAGAGHHRGQRGPPVRRRPGADLPRRRRHLPRRRRAHPRRPPPHLGEPAGALAGRPTVPRSG